MQIVCPHCTASYQVGAAAIGDTGRQVRCVRCRSVWFQEPEQASLPDLASTDFAGTGLANTDFANSDFASTDPASTDPAIDTTVAAFQSELGARPPAVEESAAEPALAFVPEAAPIGATTPENGDPAGPSLAELIESEPPEAPRDADPGEPAEAAPALSDIEIPLTDAPPLAPSDAPSPMGDRTANIEAAARRRRKGTVRRPASRWPWRTPVVIMLLAGVVASLVAFRGGVVKHVPQLASLYAAVGMPVNLRGLVFTDIRISRDSHDGVPVLVVEGVIASTASKAVEVPRIRFAMRNETGSEIYAWTALPGREVLGPGETMPFRSRLASPPGEGRDISVRFFTRLDSIAGLR